MARRARGVGGVVGLPGRSARYDCRAARRTLRGQTMKVIELRQTGREEIFAVAERARPEPRRGEIVLRMHAASVNFRDHQIASASYHVPYALPLVPLSDGVGEVVALGEDV